MVSFARVKSAFTKKDNFYALHDCGIALGNILNQATACGIEVHVMGGFSRQKVRSYFKLGDDVMPVVMFAMGHYGDNSQIPEEFAERDKKRKKRRPVEEVIFRNNPASPVLKLV